MSDPRDAKRAITAADLLAELERDQGRQGSLARADQARSREEARLHELEEPMLAELRKLGIEAESAWDLIEEPPNASVGAILVARLGRPYPPRLRASIARALATHLADEDWMTVAMTYRREANPAVRDALAAALAARGERHLSELASMATDRTLGVSRMFLLAPLTRSLQGLEVLSGLLDDPDIGSEAYRAIAGSEADDGQTADPADTLGEVGSIGVDKRSLRTVVARVSEVLGLEPSCSDAVVDAAASVVDGATRSVECHGQSGRVRIELFGDDAGSIDLYVFAEPEVASMLAPVLTSLLDEMDSDR